MTILAKDVLVLRELRDSDKIRLAELCNNRKVWDNLRDTIPFPYTENDAEFFINLCKNQSPAINFAIEYQSELVGVIGLVVQTDVYKLSAEAGYWIGEPYWGKGIATSALKLIVGYAFNELQLVRVYSGVFDYNKASQRVLEKAGFQLEGILRSSVFKNQRLIDEYRYAIINSKMIH